MFDDFNELEYSCGQFMSLKRDIFCPQKTLF